MEKNSFITPEASDPQNCKIGHRNGIDRPFSKLRCDWTHNVLFFVNAHSSLPLTLPPPSTGYMRYCYTKCEAGVIKEIIVAGRDFQKQNPFSACTQ